MIIRDWWCGLWTSSRSVDNSTAEQDSQATDPFAVDLPRHPAAAGSRGLERDPESRHGPGPHGAPEAQHRPPPTGFGSRPRSPATRPAPERARSARTSSRPRHQPTPARLLRNTRVGAGYRIPSRTGVRIMGLSGNDGHKNKHIDAAATKVNASRPATPHRPTPTSGAVNVALHPPPNPPTARPPPFPGGVPEASLPVPHDHQEWTPRPVDGHARCGQLGRRPQHHRWAIRLVDGPNPPAGCDQVGGPWLAYIIDRGYGANAGTSRSVVKPIPETMIGPGVRDPGTTPPIPRWRSCRKPLSRWVIVRWGWRFRGPLREHRV